MIKEYSKGYRDGYNDALKEADITRLYPYNLVYNVEGDAPEYDITPKQIQKCLDDHLSDRESQVLLYRYRMNLTLEEIGKRYGVTKERVRQIEFRALLKLKKYLADYRVVSIL